MYSGQLILFPTIYRIEVRFDATADGPIPPIVWESGLPVHSTQYRPLTLRLQPGATVEVKYQLHAFSRRQQNEQEQQKRGRQVAFLAATAAVLVEPPPPAINSLVSFRPRPQRRPFRPTRARKPAPGWTSPAPWRHFR